ncbi:M28 family peptidase [Streptomyces chartreusis]|uniref:M28 family peptidase n=1 Tax=Streptomyces chartreusis TaxID=1969 RepID=UPI0036C19CDF
MSQGDGARHTSENECRLASDDACLKPASLLGGRADPERLRYDVREIAGGPRSRRHAPAGIRRAEEYAIGSLAGAGWKVRSDPFYARLRSGSNFLHSRRALVLNLPKGLQGTGANLIAEHPARSPRDATVLVAAHLGTAVGSPGADDNASGVAVLLEVGRLLGNLPEPPNVTLLLFDPKDMGFTGARVAAARLSAQRPVLGMIGLDSVGYFVDEPGSQRLPIGAALAFHSVSRQVKRNEHRGDFTLVVHHRLSQSAATAWQRAAAAAEPSLPAVLLRDPCPDGRLGAMMGLAVPALNRLGRSRHTPFSNRGIPTLTLTSTAEFRNVHYHLPTDTPDTLDYRRLASVATATAMTALNWPTTFR